jgi:AP endonuclease-1
LELISSQLSTHASSTATTIDPIFIMSRRLSRKTENQIPEASSINVVATHKKGRKTVKVEEIEATAKSPARSTKKRVKVVVEHEEENIQECKDAVETKVNRVKAEAILEEEKAAKPKKAPAKRKSKATEEDEDGDSDAGVKKVTKKRKTKEEKEAEAMPLAARTVIGGLKKAMHIGAHVSAAGGTF